MQNEMIFKTVTFLLQGCLLQSLIRLHLESHKYCLEHGSSLLYSPQRHFFSTIAKQGAQSPLWQRSTQIWIPHSRVFWHVFPHGPIVSEHGASNFSLPHGHDRGIPNGHFPHDPAWHFTLHLCNPQSNVLLQILSQDHSESSQFLSIFRLPQEQLTLFFFVHGGHWSPGWQMTSQLWIPQESFRLHFLSHFQNCWMHRIVRGSDFPHSQDLCTICGHGGHGPGWHKRTHLCLQVNCLPQISPHECGTSQTWFSGFKDFLQKHV